MNDKITGYEPTLPTETSCFEPMLPEPKLPLYADSENGEYCVCCGRKCLIVTSLHLHKHYYIDESHCRNCDYWYENTTNDDQSVYEGAIIHLNFKNTPGSKRRIEWLRAKVKSQKGCCCDF